MTKKAFVAGWPISHSKSPLLHGFWLEKLGIDGTYEAKAVEEKDFEAFLKGLFAEGFVGGNVTIPHKEKAFHLIENLDEAAHSIGAVNTIWFENGVMHGGNTDAYGFMANLDSCKSEWRAGKKGLVLGAGGASRAIVFALIKAGYREIHIANRTYERAEKLAAEFGENCFAHQLENTDSLLPEMNLVVNTTSLGMNGQGNESLPDLSMLPNSAIVTDIVYTPLKTPFLAAADSLGLATVDGLGMLLHQAVPGFERWFGYRPEVTPTLRNTVLESL